MTEKEVRADSSPTKSADKLTSTLMVAAALSAIAGFAVLFSIWWQSGISENYEILRIASQEFVNGRPIIAGDLAETVEFDEPTGDATPSGRVDEPQNEEKLSAAEIARRERIKQEQLKLQESIRLRDFLIGAGKVARSRNEADSRDQRQLLLEAVPYLERSAKGGFPPGRQTEGHRILGESLFALGRYDDAIDSLRTAIQQDPTLRRSLSPRLAEAELHSIKKFPERALETIESHLQETSLQSSQIWNAEGIRIRALIDLDRWDDAARTIAKARRQAKAANVEDPELKDEKRRFLDSLILLEAIAQIQKAADRYGPIEVEGRMSRKLRAPELQDTSIRLSNLQRESMPPIPMQAKLWAARAQLIIGRTDTALALLTTVRQQRPMGPESIVSGLEEIELLARQARGEEVLQTMRYLMREMGDRKGFLAGEISFDDFRRRLTNALEQLRQHGGYEHAIDAARTLAPVFAANEALIQEGIGYRQWAIATETDGSNLSDQASRGAAKLARARYRAAGDAFAKAADLLFDTEDYLPTQWSAIEAYQRGRHFSRSIALLDPYLRYEQRRRQPRGLVAYGRALLATGDADRAIRSLTTCIDEYPRDPLRYDARLLAALAHSENGDLGTARRLLTENLQDGDLTPQSPAWRDSLFTLAELLYQRGYRTYLEAEQVEVPERLEILRDNQPTLEEAVAYLDQAVDRYKWIPRAESAAYMSARAHILASRWPRLESESPEILDAARRSLRTRSDAQLQIALDGFTQLRKHLLSREDERGLPIREQRLLRNCYIAEADVLREMERLNEAAIAYQTVELRYMNEPTALEAIVGRARCMRDMGRSNEADMLIRQASLVLSRIPQEWNGKFEETTRYNRKGWQELLTWMKQRIDNDV